MTWTFDPLAYSPTVAELLRENRLPDLGPGTPNAKVLPVLKELTVEMAFAAQTVRDPRMARCCLAAIWLHHDFLDQSHSISQEIDTPSGSCWHAIMHRREPDPGNSKYWWRRARGHPFLEALSKESPTLGYTFDSPERFVDFCEQVRGAGSGNEALARRVQQLEWQILFDWCWRQSI
jgi:hypothetical protein